MIPAQAEIGHAYHVVEIGLWPTNLEEWLADKFGPPGHRWFTSHHKIYFRDEKDWMWFELAT